jgi:hypothetical protein
MAKPDDPKPDDPKPDDSGNPSADPPAPSDDGPDAEELRNALATERKTRKRMEAEVERLKREGMDDTERQVAEAKAAGRAEALAEVNQKLVRAEVRAVAAAKLADPGDAVRLLDLDEFEVSDDGTIDTRALGNAIDKLVEAKPYLAKPTGTTAPPRVPQGTRGGPGAPATEPGGGKDDAESWLRGLVKDTTGST